MWNSGPRILIPLLSVFGSLVASQSESKPLTLEEVKVQIDNFVHSIEQNGTLSTTQCDDMSRSNVPSGCSLACAFLELARPGQVAAPGSPVYQFQESRYWSNQQAATAPTCRFAPTDACGVSLAVLTSQVTQCKFAVKSGGHGAFSGASNIDSGVTIDLINFNEVTVSADRTETAVGAGNTWSEVYSRLDPMGLGVIGGRVAAVGVGGLTLGGGMSFYSARYGWACDNVNKYEVVFADGTIRDVTHSSYPDLYFALRGGGNNFGIVTKFHLNTFTQGDLWGGMKSYLYTDETAAKLNDAFYWLNVNSASDPYAQMILSYVYFQSQNAYLAAPSFTYGKPTVKPPIFKNFTDIPGAVADTLRIANLTDLTVELNTSNPGGFRQTFWTGMVKNSPTLVADIVAIWQEETDKVKGAAGVLPSISFQGVPVEMIAQFSKNGGNALGMTPDDGPLVLVLIACSWSSAADDERILASARAGIERMNATAYAQDLGHPYIYMNYAGQDQHVIASYGQENVQKLKQASKKYDPFGVWQKLQPGYHKLF